MRLINQHNEWDGKGDKINNLTSSPKASNISLFSLSPGPMCRSAKSSCLGKMRSICLDEAAADVLRPRAAAVVRDAELRWSRILLWSFQTTRLPSLRCLHSALGFTDLATKTLQDLPQLCISNSLCGTSVPGGKNPVDLCSAPFLSGDVPSTVRGDSLLPTLLTAHFPLLHSSRRADQSRAAMLRDAATSPGKTAA